VPDPWAILGLGPGSSLADARAARRRLAKQLHPDLHAARPAAEQAELARRMTQVNLAVAELESGGPALAGGGTGTGSGPTTRTGSGARTAAPNGDQPHPASAVLDADSFTVEALPADAFESVFLAGYVLGEILVADEPYALELYLPGPPPCFCQLFLVPEAGGSIVTLDLTPAEDAEPPDAQAVRDLLVSELNRLAGSPQP
jgi:hypothetical protein